MKRLPAARLALTALLALAVFAPAACKTTGYHLDVLAEIHDENYDLQYGVAVATPLQRVLDSLSGVLTGSPSDREARFIENPGMLCQETILELTWSLPRDLGEYSRAIGILGPISALGENPASRGFALRTMMFLRAKYPVPADLDVGTDLERSIADESLPRLRELLARFRSNPEDAEARAGCREEFDLLGRIDYDRITEAASVLKLFWTFYGKRGHPDFADTVDAGIHRVTERTIHLSLTSALRDTEDFIREDAIQALGEWNDPEDLPLLAARLRRDRSPSVRREAAQALGWMGYPDAVPELIESLEGDDDTNVRWNAMASLEAISGESLGPFAPPWRRWWSAYLADEREETEEKASS